MGIGRSFTLPTLDSMYALNEHQMQIVEKAKKLGQEVLGKYAREVDEKGRFPTESIKALQEAGFMGLIVSTSYGGWGEGPRTFAAVVDTLAQYCGSTAMVYLMHICGTAAIQAYPPVHGDRILRDIVAGRHLTTLAFSEKGSRSHFWAPVSQARQNGSFHIVSCEKSWVTSASNADSYILSTKAPEARGPMEWNMYFVLATTPGIKVEGPWDGLGLRGNDSAPVTFQNASIPMDQRVCEPGAGFNAAFQHVLPWFQIGNAAISVGLAEAAIQSSIQHAIQTQFQHLGTNLASLPNIRANLAKMRMEVDACRALVAKVAEKMEKPDATTVLGVLECKAACNEMALRVTELAMRTCGGAAFSKHLTVERNFRDSRAGAVMAPTSDILYDFIGKALIGMDLFA